MRCLLIDNYDSFTWNLADYLGRAFGEPPTVVYNDQYGWDELDVRKRFDCIVVSPGPGSVTREADFNVSRQAVLQTDLPVFGVCLGFQGIAHFHGCDITYAPVPYHGRSSQVRHDGDRLFAGIPPTFDVVRYHSLMVAPNLSDQIVATAHTDTGLIMAIRHASLPKWGVQFHPESILTEYGIEMIQNFRDLSREFHGRTTHTVPAGVPTISSSTVDAASPGPTSDRMLRVIALEVRPPVADAQDLFAELFADRENCFWLDSQVAISGMSRYSFMGDADSADVHRYWLDQDGEDFATGRQLLSELDRELETVKVEEHALPFEFRGGFVGFLTYEMKALFGGERGGRGSMPDALWIRTHNFVAYDHVDRRAWAVALCDPAEVKAGQQWVQAMVDRIIAVPTHVDRARRKWQPVDGVEVEMSLSHEEYLAAIEDCQRAVVEGESYEICLTNHFGIEADVDPFALYCEMRHGNPAPFGAYVRCGSHAVLSTSPERFLRVSQDACIQTKPIKGTCRRSHDPEQDAALAHALSESVKDRAENLMIVDLMRNDLNRVSVRGSVRVPKLRAIESYRTVHQMVSTIESTLRPDCSLMDLVSATFPGGSITGAPKIRTMEIIDRLEKATRGVYCGSIGFLGYNRVADLNIAIRTVSYDGSRLQFGAGGAITYLSDPESEFQEILLKAEVVLRPILRHLTGCDTDLEYEILGRSLRLVEPVEAVSFEE